VISIRASSRPARVFSRTAKEIDLSIEARTALGVTAAKVTPQEAMNAILKAPVDLLWFGASAPTCAHRVNPTTLSRPRQ